MELLHLPASRTLIALSVSLALITAAQPASAAKPQPAGMKTEMKYEGGSLELDQHDRVDVFIAPDKLTVVQGKKRHEIPTRALTEVSYGNDVHRRVGAAIGVAAVTLGIGALMMFVKTKKHYVGVTWADGDNKGGTVFKVGKGEYRGFVKALEGVSGLTAVNADQIGSGGTSK